jgi:crotonobetainyl-CoA:carnitine CoA-transferase CaiB-like acyl-CoA transferase
VTQDKQASAPLAHLVVVDSTWGTPGAIASMLLADYGARVIKVERPGGAPDARLVNRKAFDRGKWSVELDLKARDGRSAMAALLGRADVLLHNHRRPAAVGLDPVRLAVANPRLINCSLSAYGEQGPWRDRPGFESLVAARMGFMAEQPGHRPAPVFLGHQSIAYVTGMLAAIGILSALRARRETGAGQHLDVSLLDGVLAQCPINWWWTETGESHLGKADGGATYGRKRLVNEPVICGDGEWLIVHSGGEGAFKALMDVIGRGDRIRAITGSPENSVDLDDDEYQQVLDMPTAFLARPRAEWIELLTAADVAVVPMLRPGEVYSHPQVEQARVMVTIPDRDFGELHQVGPVIKFQGLELPTPAPAPLIGEHGEAVAEWLSHSAPAERAPTEAAPTKPLAQPLQGIKVVDVCTFFAAAYGAKFLRDLGADVIKVEPPNMDPMRPLAEPFEGCNRGKRAVVVDIRRPEGLEVFYDLIRDADIVTNNMRPGKSEKAGIGFADLVKINPRLIYIYQPGWGSHGPLANAKSFAPLLSGMTGLNYEAAGEGNEPVRRARASEDYYGGLLGAISALMALERRANGAGAQFIEAPQLHASLFTTTEQMLDSGGNLITGLHLNKEQTGFSALHRLYQTRDGWICLAAGQPRAFERLCSTLGISGIGPGEPGLPEAIAGALATRATGEAFEALDRAGVPCEIARDTPFMSEFWWEDWAVDLGYVYEHHHATFGWVREVGSVIQMPEMPMVKRWAAPLFGEHTVEVLKELGYDKARIDGLLAAKVCRAPDVAAPVVAQ